MVKFASPSCVRFISFGFLLATTCVWVWMVCSLHSVTTGSRDRAIMPLIIIIGSIFHDCNVPLYICLHSSVVVETALSYFRNFQQWEEDHPLATSLILGATSYRDIYVAS